VPVELNPVKGADLAPGVFLQRWQCRRSEITAVKQAAKLTSNNHARLHVLSINGIDHGFVTIGIHQHKNQKQFHLHVIYLFVSNQFRKNKISELEGLQASEYMIGNIIAHALELSTFLPISSIVLETASDKLYPLYESLGFSKVPDMADWMSLPLPH
jgi:hypothetical protein